MSSWVRLKREKRGEWKSSAALHFYSLHWSRHCMRYSSQPGTYKQGCCNHHYHPSLLFIWLHVPLVLIVNAKSFRVSLLYHRLCDSWLHPFDGSFVVCILIHSQSIQQWFACENECDVMIPMFRTTFTGLDHITLLFPTTMHQDTIVWYQYNPLMRIRMIKGI